MLTTFAATFALGSLIAREHAQIRDPGNPCPVVGAVVQTIRQTYSSHTNIPAQPAAQPLAAREIWARWTGSLWKAFWNDSGADSGNQDLP
jgi:hypothetical protein